MYVCLCKGITDRQIIAALTDGAANVRDLRDKLGVMTECGKCACFTRDLIRNHQAQIDQNQPPLWAAAS